jgi:type I site-specific restriction endonuclease
VIDNHEPRAEALIDEFKTPGSPLRIAISVDMLDTGIDVPEGSSTSSSPSPSSRTSSSGR